MDNKLKISTSVVTGITILKIEGEMDLYTIGDFHKAFDDMIDSGTTNLVIDLLEVMYLDSSGLSALLSMHRKITSVNGCLSVVTSPDKKSITRIFEITRLNTVLKMFNTVDDAVSYNTQAIKI